MWEKAGQNFGCAIKLALPRVASNKRYLFLVLAAGLACSAVHSEISPSPGSPVRLSLEESLAFARAGNAALLSERLSTSIASNRAKYSWNAFLPSLSLGATFRNTHDLAGGSNSDRIGNSFDASAGLSLTLTSGVVETRKQLGLFRDAANLSLLNEEAKTERDVKVAYYFLLADRDALELADGDIALAKRQAEFVRKNYESGLASELELLQSRYTVASGEPKIDEARRAFRQSCREFALLLGIEPSGDIELTDRLEADPRPVRLSEPVEAYVERGYAVQAARTAVEIARSERRAGLLTRRGPTVSLSESIGIANLDEGFHAPETGTFTLSVAIPLNGYVPGSKEWLSGQEQETVIRQTEISLAQARRESLSRIHGLIERVDGLFRAIELAAMNERLAERTHELSGQGYRAGLVTQTEHDIARQRLLEARLVAVTAAYQYKIGIIELAHGLGVSESEVCAGEAGR